MSVTVETCARGVLAALATSANILLAGQWVADRYTQIAARTRLRHLRKLGTVFVPAPVTVGLATFTRGSDAVVGDAAAQAVWTNDVIGRFVRARTAWYEILGVQSSELRLGSAFGEDTVTLGAYRIVQKFSLLDPEARWVSDTIVSQRRRHPLDRVPLDVLNQEAPSRTSAAQPATMWAELGSRVGADGKKAKALEFYPYSDRSEVYHYVFYPTAPTLGLHDELPPEIDEHVLREGALIDVMRYEMAKALREGQPEVAATWRNEYRAQITYWDRVMLDAYRADKAMDDLTFILQNARLASPGDIRTARDEIYARGQRP